MRLVRAPGLELPDLGGPGYIEFDAVKDASQRLRQAIGALRDMTDFAVCCGGNDGDWLAGTLRTST